MLRGDRVCPGATDSLPLQCSGRPRLCWALLCLLLRATGSAPVVRWTFCRTFACALPLLLRVTGSAPVARWICRASPHARLASLATALPCTAARSPRLACHPVPVPRLRAHCRARSPRLVCIMVCNVLRFAFRCPSFEGRGVPRPATTLKALGVVVAGTRPPVAASLKPHVSLCRYAPGSSPLVFEVGLPV